MADDYQFDDLDTSATPSNTGGPTGATTGGGQSDHGYNNSSQGNGKYADELFSKQIKAKFRTFYLDLKQSNSGKFLKISEKSRGGQKSTIMMDEEDITVFIEALKEVQQQLQ